MNAPLLTKLFFVSIVMGIVVGVTLSIKSSNGPSPTPTPTPTVGPPYTVAGSRDAQSQKCSVVFTGGPTQPFVSGTNLLNSVDFGACCLSFQVDVPADWYLTQPSQIFAFALPGNWTSNIDAATSTLDAIDLVGPLGPVTPQVSTPTPPITFTSFTGPVGSNPNDSVISYIFTPTYLNGTCSNILERFGVTV